MYYAAGILLPMGFGIAAATLRNTIGPLRFALMPAAVILEFMVMLPVLSFAMSSDRTIAEEASLRAGETVLVIVVGVMVFFYVGWIIGRALRALSR